MEEKPEDIKVLMSGYLDGGLGPDEEARLESYLSENEEGRSELESLRQLVDAASTLHVEPPPEAVLDTFLDNVYNRVERKTGWTVLILGAIIAGTFGIYLLAAVPWPSPVVKAGVAVPFVGLIILFVSVWRQRLFVSKTDRYSRDVRR
jgi:anti-sigma factor RsiW